MSDHELSPSEELETGELARFALEVTGLGCWEVDVVTGTVRRSRRYDQIFGHDAPLPFWDHERFLEQVHTEDRVAVDTLYREALTAGTDWQFVCRIHRANDGAFRRVEIRGRHLAASDGLPGRLLGTVRDITEVEQATRTAREIAAQLRFITDAAPLLISYVDAGLRYRFVNEGYT
ncbi:MAG: PAS domain-containing protein, partial [Cytophagales bacterium]|nr:PAS domain-containing protein [Armatimonadota bacterium]